MRVTNNTNIPTPFLRDLARWTLKQCRTAPGWDIVVSFRATSQPTRTARSSTYGAFDRRVGTYGTQVTIHIGPAHFTDGEGAGPLAQGRIYLCILHLAKALAGYGGPRIPQGELGLYRQPVGAAFLSQAQTLIHEWSKKVKAVDPRAGLKKKAAHAEKMVKSWTRQTKLAQTKLKQWTRRLRRAKKALEDETQG